jgi:DNA topoisomerase-1
MALIIVESPTKARTFNRILKGQDYFVFATMGHIRDLPGDKMAVNFDNQFEPQYEIIKNKEKTVAKLKELAKENNEVILATDADREGESISYHAAYLLGLIDEKWPEIGFKKGVEVKRIVFHEITPNALKEALEHPSELRIDLVKAQQARRILDRIVGYQLSPLLWKKMNKNWLSAGRVQSVALRIIVEREKEIKAFKLEDYFQIYGEFKHTNVLKAKLLSKDEVPYEQKFKLELFAGEYTYTKTTISEQNKDELENDIKTDTYTVASITEEIGNKYPPPPYTTSLLQMDMFQKMGLSSKMTMRIAQDLYERGLITYHRTDSFNLSTQFVFRAKDYIEATYGKEYALEKPRGFRTKSKNAQEAHEAIRPTRLDKAVETIETDKKITANHKKVYKYIFDRAVATQMKEASVKNIKVNILGKKGYLFQAELQKVLFDGFLKVLNPEYVQKNQFEAPFKQGDSLSLETLEATPSQTKAPPRYNESSLIKIMEEKGIGRPSTYAPIISLIQDKNYVEKQYRYFAPTKLGEAISDYLSKSFSEFFNLEFTAKMEEELDEVADGKYNMVQLLKEMNDPLQKEIKEKEKDTEVIEIDETLDEKCPNCGSPLTVKFSRFGKFMACSNYPTCKFTKPFLNYVNGKYCPIDAGRVTVRYSRAKTKFFGCENWPKCQFISWTLADTMTTPTPNPNYVQPPRKEYKPGEKKVVKKAAKKRKKKSSKKIAKKTTKKSTSKS